MAYTGLAFSRGRVPLSCAPPAPQPPAPCPGVPPLPAPRPAPASRRAGAGRLRHRRGARRGALRAGEGAARRGRRRAGDRRVPQRVPPRRQPPRRRGSTMPTCCVERGELEEAIGQFLRLVEQDWSRPRRATSGWPSSRSRSQDFATAETHADRAYELAPDDPEVRALKATVDYRSGEPRRRGGDGARVLEETPDHLTARNGADRRAHRRRRPRGRARPGRRRARRAPRRTRPAPRRARACSRRPATARRSGRRSPGRPRSSPRTTASPSR